MLFKFISELICEIDCTLYFINLLSLTISMVLYNMLANADCLNLLFKPFCDFKMQTDSSNFYLTLLIGCFIFRALFLETNFFESFLFVSVKFGE